MDALKHPDHPCKACPYRLDAPLAHWHRDHYQSVADAEADFFGSIFACHGHAKLPEKERGMCAGWLLDQKNRNVPSIALRMALRDPETAAAFEAVHSTVPMFPSAQAMVRANLRAMDSSRRVVSGKKAPMTFAERCAETIRKTPGAIVVIEDPPDGDEYETVALELHALGWLCTRTESAKAARLTLTR